MNIKKFKYPLVAAGVLGTAMGLTYTFNHLGISPPFNTTALLILSAAVADHQTTMEALKLGGKEGNPFANMFFNIFGAQTGGAIILGLFVLFVVYVFQNVPPHQQLAFGCAYWIVPVNNLLVIRRLRKEVNSAK